MHRGDYCIVVVVRSTLPNKGCKLAAASAALALGWNAGYKFLCEKAAQAVSEG
jgi:hypothetical protein